MEGATANINCGSQMADGGLVGSLSVISQFSFVMAFSKAIALTSNSIGSESLPALKRSRARSACPTAIT